MAGGKYNAGNERREKISWKGAVAGGTDPPLTVESERFERVTEKRRENRRDTAERELGREGGRGEQRKERRKRERSD